MESSSTRQVGGCGRVNVFGGRRRNDRVTVNSRTTPCSGRRRLLAEHLGEGLLQIPIQVGAGNGGSRRLRGVPAGPPLRSRTGRRRTERRAETRFIGIFANGGKSRRKPPPPRPDMPSGLLPGSPLRTLLAAHRSPYASFPSPLDDSFLNNRSKWNICRNPRSVNMRGRGAEMGLDAAAESPFGANACRIPPSCRLNRI